MIDALPLLLGPEGYQINRSLRFRSSASAYLNRTLTTPTNNLKWTWSGWVKRGTLSVSNVFFGAGDGSSNNFGSLQFTTGNTIQFAQINGGAYNVQMVTSAVFRDPSAWYHLVIIYDSANATSTDRVQIYVNGVRQSVTYSTGPFAQNTASKINSAIAHYTGKLDYAGVYFDGYITENNFIDGQALDPSYFGETNPVTGVWQPKKYAGTYGTNGFYLNFSDNSAATAAAIGKDYSGNGNNWTPNNITLSPTTSVSYDSMLDVPTQWADGGNGRGNYCTGNPLIMYNGGGGAPIVPKNGNLDLIGGAGWAMVGSTIAVSTGKWYWEATFFKPGSGDGVLGIHKSNTSLFQIVGYSGDPNGYGYAANGNKQNNSTGVAYGASYTNGDVIGVALDLDAGTLTFYKNNTSQGVAFSSLSGEFFPAFSSETAYFQANFGQRPFAYTPPSGFKALNTLNLPTPTILKGNQYFDATTYSGQNTALSVTNSGSMQPDLVWIKKRNGATDHNLTDAVRGTNRNIISNSTAVEDTVARLTSFDTGGFTLAGAFDNTNISGSTYVGWQWKEGATQGFDIVTYTGDGASGRDIAHSLGVVPSMIITKARTSSTYSWHAWHIGIGANYYIALNTTSARDNSVNIFPYAGISSSSFRTSTAAIAYNNLSAVTYVAYLFAEVAGFSKFGSYTGNGSADGPFVFCGFRPRFIMVKRTDSTSNWTIHDTSRDSYNVAAADLRANTSDVEVANANTQNDILSNGFKVRHTAGVYNANGGTYIFAAFAENPFKNALAR